MKKLLVSVLAMILAMQPAIAGVIVMKNGDRITGSIKKIWDGDVFI